jgi:AAA+ ATPase superfamily predicted ATPase
MAKALPEASEQEVLEQFSIWGGVPRYWELAAEFTRVSQAIQNLILAPQGVLHNEPRHLLIDEMKDIVQASSILMLVGQGCHRLSEIAARLGKPATSLTRPLLNLQELGLIAREIPFGADERNGKKSLYRLADPFLAFWFRFVQPNRSLLESASVSSVYRMISPMIPQHTAEVFEVLARRCVPRLAIAGQEWGSARRWWGSGHSGQQMEIDVVAESLDGKNLLLGEVKLSATAVEMDRIQKQLQVKGAQLPFAKRYQRVETVVFSAAESAATEKANVVGLPDLLRVLV